MKKHILPNNQLKKSNQMLPKNPINQLVKKPNSKPAITRTMILVMAVMKRRIKHISLKNQPQASSSRSNHNNSSSHSQCNSALKLKATKNQMVIVLLKMGSNNSNQHKSLGMVRTDKDQSSRSQFHNQQEMWIFPMLMASRQLIYLLTLSSYLTWQITIITIINPCKLSLLSYPQTNSPLNSSSNNCSNNNNKLRNNSNNRIKTSKLWINYNN